MKICTLCKALKKISEFYRREARCKPCYNSRTPQFKAFKKLNTIKGLTPCADCGKLFPYYIMEYDHVPERGEKVAAVTRLVAHYSSLEHPVVVAEIDKCDLVCANCHKIRTYFRRNPSDAPR